MYIYLRTFFWTFPIEFLGKSSTNITLLGHLNDANFSLVYLIISFSVISPYFTITAITASPKSASGIPITADSTTPLI